MNSPDSDFLRKKGGFACGWGIVSKGLDIIHKVVNIVDTIGKKGNNKTGYGLNPKGFLLSMSSICTNFAEQKH